MGDDPKTVVLQLDKNLVVRRGVGLVRLRWGKVGRLTAGDGRYREAASGLSAAYAGARRPVSQIVRFMLYTRLASPIFTRALARPIVRTTSPIGPFSCANTCSTAARTFDLAPFARAVCLGIGLRGGFLRWICERRPFLARASRSHVNDRPYRMPRKPRTAPRSRAGPSG